MWRAGNQETTRLAALFRMMDGVILRALGWSVGSWAATSTLHPLPTNIQQVDTRS